MARILDASTMAALDMIADVREAFRKFQAWMIEALPAGSLVAFAPILAMQIRSALSHVSSEIREDGLLLLELYASRLSGAQVLSQAESSRIVQTLCQVTTVRPMADRSEDFFCNDNTLLCQCMMSWPVADRGEEIFLQR